MVNDSYFPFDGRTRHDYVYRIGAYSSTWYKWSIIWGMKIRYTKIKVKLYWKILRYMQIHMHKVNWKQQKHVYLLSYVKINLKLISKMETNIQTRVNNPRHQTPQRQEFQSLESPVEYHSSEYKLDMQESDGNIFSPILRKKCRGEIILCMMKIGQGTHSHDHLKGMGWAEDT